ncbi:MAG: anti-sigma factor [Chloroflexi bacterium]|nr:anti-sigma factor [Chloroflexota bacterium]
MTLSHGDVIERAAGFVLGALTPADDAAVREHLASCPEAHPEFESLGSVVPYLAESLEPVEPPAELRARLLAAAAAEPRGVGGERRAAPQSAAIPPAPAAAPPAAAPIPFPSAAERTVRADRTAASPAGAGTWLVRIAAALAIAVLGAWNVQLQSRLGNLEGDLATARAYQDAVMSALAIASQPGGQTAFMSGSDPSVTASGVAAVSPEGRLVLAMRGLKPTTGAEVYEAWVIVGDAAPVPIGGFQVGSAGTGTFTATTGLAEPGAIVALTLEPLPNATAPTLPVLSVGTLGGANG